jgi:small-conductance mechanosensitive channel
MAPDHDPPTPARAIVTMSPFSRLEAFATHVLAELPAVLAIVAGAFALKYLAGRAWGLLTNKTAMDPSDVAPLRRITNVVIWFSMIVLLLGAFGVNLGGIWTMLTGALALFGVGFIAVWSVLSNWLCTIVILITRPFAIGDDIELAGEQVRGRVIDLNFIYTTLRSEDGCTLQIPNNLFFQRVLKRRHGTGSVSLAQQLNRRQEPTS